LELALQVGIFVVALAGLVKGSDWFIDSAESIGLSFGISPFIIGVTIVAFGTSLPELATSISSVLQGESEVVVGNVVGSNIANIALVMGLVAVTVRMIRLDYNIWHNDMGFLLGSSFLLYFSVWDGYFSIFEAIIFLMALLLFLWYSFTDSENKTDEEEEDQDKEKITTKTWILLLIGGLLVWQGADWTIKSISAMAKMASISPEIIALTAVAIGTSLPEVIVSVGAAKKGKTSIAIGNVLGSNIFNTFFVMAIPSFFGTLEIPEKVITFYLPFMIVMTILFAVMTSNKKVSQWEGYLLIVFYCFYLVTTISSI